jgi:uncharacterized protein with HEPN domain
MDIEINAWLFDIVQAINEIESFFGGKPPVFPAYRDDLRTKRAVERNIEIIGEAVNRIVKKNPQISLSGTRAIVDTRNRIIHGYDSVSDDVMWGIITGHLPQLKAEAEKLLH